MTVHAYQGLQEEIIDCMWSITLTCACVCFLHMPLIAIAVSHLRCYEDANGFTTCLDECVHSDGAAAADLDGG